MKKVSVKAVSRSATSQDRKARATALKQGSQDSFQNLMLGLGIGTGNPSSFNQYQLNPITRNRTQLEWMYRGDWLASAGVDIIADDMTRAGVELRGELDPGDVEQIEEAAVHLNIHGETNHCIKIGRLYGGALGVMLIDGADMATPLRVETIGKGQFRGLIVLDRWMLQPELGDLVSEIGPHLGAPKFYTVLSSAPALRGQKIHYSRCLRMIGVKLPYWQALTESLWGMSVLERPFDVITQFRSATTGASQLVSKAYLRYFKVKNYRQIVAAGGPAFAGLQQMVQSMRMFASNEGISLIDAEDDLVTTQSTAFTGIAEMMMRLGQQVSGAFNVPQTLLFGDSPDGMNATGESDLRNHYDHIRQLQELNLRVFMTTLYRCLAASLGITLSDGFSITFRPLWQLDEVGKADVAQKMTATILSAKESGVASDKLTLQELKKVAHVTGVWSHIDEAMINAAEDEVLPPIPEASELGASGAGGNAVGEAQIERGEKREQEEAAA